MHLEVTSWLLLLNYSHLNETTPKKAWLLNESRMLNRIQTIVHSTSQHTTSWSDESLWRGYVPTSFWTDRHVALCWLVGRTMTWVRIQRWNESNFTQLISADISRHQSPCYFKVLFAVHQPCIPLLCLASEANMASLSWRLGGVLFQALWLAECSGD